MNSNTDEKTSMKRVQMDKEDGDKQVGKRARITSSSPPENNQTLGFYCKDDWWKEDITEGEKGRTRSRTIQFLRNDSEIHELAQARLKINLKTFLDTGQVVSQADDDKLAGKGGGPPENNQTLAYYCKDDWWKEGVTEEEKRGTQDLRIENLSNVAIFHELAQARLKIELRLFLDTGQVAFANEAPYGIVGRVASLDYDIQESQLLYKRDFNAFRDRVEKLFQWKKSEHGEYMAPYFPLIQSSGTGKTKLMHEYRRSVLGSKSNVRCELILCHHGEVGHLVSSRNRDRIYSGTLDVQEFIVSEEGREKLWDKLTKLVHTAEQEKEKEKLVLLFDESQHLVNHGDGWHFRSIRWWLRGQRPNSVGVVGVFAGTNTSLANYFTEPGPSTSSRDQKHEYNEGSKLYPPFYEITTTGLTSLTSLTSLTARTGMHGTEFDIAVQYGRPLFARMQLKGNLTKCALGSILMRMRGRARDNTLFTGSTQQQQQQQQQQQEQQDYSILACRLQMGQVPFDFASKQVSAGYAHLTHFAPEQTTVAEIAYLPDPVCAWLAMTQMIGNCSLFAKVDNTYMKPSEPPSAWSEKAIKMYSSGLCRPEKGDVGEVAAAFYMLVCGDALRYEDDQDLTKLSVSLEDWLHRLRKGNLHPNPHHDDSKIVSGPSRPSINFIQVCRNYLRPSLKEVQDGELLKHWYRGARACYAHASCEAYDLLIPVQYRVDRAGKEGKDDMDDVDLRYCPMLVSVKNRSLYGENQRKAAVDAMKAMLARSKIKTGVCMLLLIGLESRSPSTAPATSPTTTMSTTPTRTTSSSSGSSSGSSCVPSEFVFSPEGISTMVVEVPKDDDFGATNLALCSTCAGGERSEVMASHAELALGAEQKFDRLLRSRTKGDDPSAIFLEEIKDGYEKARARLS